MSDEDNTQQFPDPGQEHPRGSMRYQDPDTTTPREPSLAEQRARRAAEEAETTRLRDEAAEAERKARLRKRVMIGGGVTVGVAALVGAWYLAQPDDVTAYCATTDTSQVGQDNYCDEAYVTSHGGHFSGGFFFIPILGHPGQFRQYHYNYGGTVSNGHVVGGSTVRPNNANINTRSGKSIQRGGFGVGGSRSGKSGGS